MGVVGVIFFKYYLFKFNNYTFKFQPPPRSKVGTHKKMDTVQLL